MSGMQVCLRSSPMYHHGAVAFTTVDGPPRVGTLMESAWSLDNTCRFKIRTTLSDLKPPEEKPPPSENTIKVDMPPPPSPASSTCSDHSTSSILSPGAALSKYLIQQLYEGFTLH